MGFGALVVEHPRRHAAGAIFACCWFLLHNKVNRRDGILVTERGALLASMGIIEGEFGAHATRPRFLLAKRMLDQNGGVAGGPGEFV
jgi:hypothetical protein